MTTARAESPVEGAGRCLQPEVMDDPALDARAHEHALAGLARLNACSRSAACIVRVLRTAGMLHPGSDASLLDIATGSADIPLAVARSAARRGVTLRVSAIDRSPRAVAIARSRFQLAGLPIDARVGDVLDLSTDQQHDIVTCSLFLHHLTHAQGVALLATMRTLARRLAVVNDLSRSRRGTLLAWSASRLLTRSPVVHTDAVLSARAAFTTDEVRHMADEAGVPGATVRRAWPCRLVLTWGAT